MNKVTIDPITRLEGHGKIEIFLNDEGGVENAYLQVPELRGFERFAEGRPVEELPRITPRICGVCPDAHHMASVKACDAVYNVDIPPTAKKLRELWYNAFYAGDHCTHFYILAGPDFVMGPDADPAERNILGVIQKVGIDVGKRVIQQRKEAHEVITIFGGKPTHPVGAIPGGLSKGINEEERQRILEIGKGMVEFGQFSLELFADVVLKNQDYMDIVLSPAFANQTYYVGLVDENNCVNVYDGHARVVDPEGKEFATFTADEYTDHLAEHVEPWSYLKFPYLKKVGWKGLVDGADSGVFRSAPLARLNAADGMATPLAQEAYDNMYSTVGAKPIHATMAFHWARLIEMLYNGERVVELASDPEITSDDIHKVPTGTPSEGVGWVEAPRGLLIHHYKTDDNGIVEKANLIVGTTQNKAGICLSVKQAAQAVIKPGGEVTEGILNIVEMAFRAYDPCFGCATHALPGQMPLIVTVRNSKGEEIQEIRRDG